MSDEPIEINVDDAETISHDYTELRYDWEKGAWRVIYEEHGVSPNDGSRA